MTRFFGGLLMAIGILIATLSGLCSAWFLVMTLGSYGGDGSALMFIALIGGVPFVSGVGMFYAGRALVRGARERDE